eukprot:1481592-Pyramimonas_sp.AAC.1
MASLLLRLGPITRLTHHRMSGGHISLRCDDMLIDWAYTDGSCMDVLNEDGDKEARTGVGVFSQRDDVRLSFRTIVPVSVLHAELA